MRLAEIAAHVGGTLDGDGSVEIRGVSSIEDALPGTLTFLADQRHADRLRSTRAAAVLVATTAPAAPLPVVRVPDPYAAFVAAVSLFHPPERQPPGVHPTAVVSASARLGANAHVGPHVIVGGEVVLGDDCVLHAGVVLYPRVRAGHRFTAHARVVVREDVRIGDGVTLHAGAVVGSDGFGYLPSAEGIQRIPQVGTVVLEDDVEVGANATIDRAALGTTLIGRGTKIDNLVMVAHGCTIGPHCLLAAQVGLAGGTTLGRGVMLGGQVGASGHLTIGDGARVAAKAGIAGNLSAGRTYGGIPAMEIRQWRREVAALTRLPELVRRLRRVERKLGMRGGDTDDAE